PFQVGIQYEQYIATPTRVDADHWLATETFARQSDSHFLFPPDWMPAVYSPTENNDASLGTYTDPCGRTEVRGVGGMRVATAVPVPDRVPSIDVLRVGILSGTAVYFDGENVRYRDLPDGGYDVEVRDLAGIQFPMLYENTWQGSGTGGQTSTDPNDPTVQWNQLANWSRGVLPGAADDVRIEMTNPGQVVGASGTVGSLWVDSTVPGTSFLVPTGADLESVGSMVFGVNGVGTGLQSGNCRASLLTLGEEAGSEGLYQLTDGHLTVQAAYLGKFGAGTLVQDGGAFEVSGSLRMGGWHGGSGDTYRLSDGSLSVGTLQVGWKSSATFSQLGGSVKAGEVLVEHLSEYVLEEGVLAPERLQMSYGYFTQRGGSVGAGTVVVDQWSSGYTLEGGVLDAAQLQVTGRFTQRGGSVKAGNALTGTYVLEGGVLETGQSDVGGFTHTQGTHRVLGDLMLHGEYELQGGLLTAAQGSIYGQLVQTDGQCRIAGALQCFDHGYLSLHGGTLCVHDELLAGSPGVGWQDGGLHQVTGTLTVKGIPKVGAGLYQLKAGVLDAGTEVLENDSQMYSTTFDQTGGTNLVRSQLVLTTDPNGWGAYYLKGGLLMVPEIVKGPGLATFEQTGGVLSAGSISGPVSLSGGEFSVQAMDGVLVNDGGVISPGSSIGTMILGGLVQNSGALEIELGSLIDFDQVLITESAQLGGELKIDLLGGYLPAIGSEYPILTAGSGITGAFALVSEGYETRVDGGDTLMLVVIPEPATACLIALGGIRFLLRRPKTKGRRAGPLPTPAIFAGVWPARRTRPWRGVWASGRTGSG
ncbi:MAG: hypothetical protein MUP47_01625, partial [Phycisphaerae bacterium]|nr:hypothetical protein [Phycisphaerae bacterium]